MIVHLSYPFDGGVDSLLHAKLWLQWATVVAQDLSDEPRTPLLDQEIFVIAPWISLCETLGETEADYRYWLRGTLNLFTALARAGYVFAVWSFGVPSIVTRFEQSAALFHGGEVWDFMALGPRPPPGYFDPREHPKARRLERHKDVAPEWWRVAE